jgi:F0F1-type ATP synthase delta subunit
MDIQQLSRFLKTAGDAADLQHALESLSDGIYRTDISVEELLRKSLPYEQALVIIKLASQQGLQMEDKAHAQEFFTKVRDAIKALPSVQITLAMKPNATLVGLIHDWFYRTYKKLVLLDILVNPDIVAGSIISANGK